MRDVLVVLTTPNRGKSYLKDTLASLDRAGADQKIVIVDGEPDETIRSTALSTGWGIVPIPGGPVGNLKAVFAAFRFGAEFDRMLFFEDDVVACKSAVHRMRQIGVPDDCAFISFFDMKDCPYGAADGLRKVPVMGADGRGFWGTQAVMFPQRTMKYLVENARYWVDEVPNKHSADALFSHQLLYSPWTEYALHVPNLVEHVGEVSSVFSWVPKVNRKATSFRGEGFDALTL